MGVNVTGLFLLAYLCDVLSVPLLNQVHRREGSPKITQNVLFLTVFLRLVPGRCFMFILVDFSAIWAPFGRLLAIFFRFMGFCWIALPLARKPTF